MSNEGPSKLWYAISLAAQLGFLVVIPMVGFSLLGVYLDRRLGTSPWGLLVGLAVSLAVTVYELKNLLGPLLAPDDPEAPDAKPEEHP